MTLLKVKNLQVDFPSRYGPIKVIRGIDLNIKAGERVGIVGESGAGKSMAAFAIMNLISEPGYISAGSVEFEGSDLASISEEDMRKLMGDRIAMIFQDPMMTLNPVLTIGDQMVETLQAHRKISYQEARTLSIEKLREVRIPSPEARFDGYPHELSGGLRQRVVIAIALLSDPALIIADEPTTALDVTIQAEILALLLELCREHGTALILITHDLAVVSQVTERIVVMYAGNIIEYGSTKKVTETPTHPYTMGLIAALPEQNAPGTPLNQIPGSMPSPMAIPEGCAFSPRCDFADKKCTKDIPELREVKGRMVACHHAGKLKRSRKAGK